MLIVFWYDTEFKKKKTNFNFINWKISIYYFQRQTLIYIKLKSIFTKLKQFSSKNNRTMYQNSYIIERISYLHLKIFNLWWTFILPDAISNSIPLLGNLRCVQNAKPKKGRNKFKKRVFFILARWIELSFRKPVQVLSV